MIGIDMVEISRMVSVSEHFDERVFTAAELCYCAAKHDAAQSKAGIYAAKEAVAKALKSGISFALTDIEITHEQGGAPKVILHGKAAELAGGRRAHVSISHDGGMAIAACVLEESE